MYSFSLPLPSVSCNCSPFCWCILMDDQLNEVVDSVKDGEPLLDSVLVHMGSMYSTLGKFEKSMSAYRRAVSNMENRYGKLSCQFGAFTTRNSVGCSELGYTSSLVNDTWWSNYSISLKCITIMLCMSII